MLGWASRSSWHRVEFYYEHGLIPVMPTPEQFAAGCSHNRLASELRRKLVPNLKRVFSKEAWIRSAPVSSNPGEVVVGGTMYRSAHGWERRDDATLAVDLDEKFRPGIESLLARLADVDILRAVIIHAVVPEALTGGLGFQISTSHIVNHLLMSPHPSEHAVWDLQLIQPDPGGLDLFECRLDAARTGRGLRGKALRSLGTVRGQGGHLYELVRYEDPQTGRVSYVDATAAEGGEVLTTRQQWDEWYDHVGETIARARRFEYEDCKYPAPSVPEFLNLCAQLTPDDFEFFRDKKIFRSHPEIDWPRAAAESPRSTH